MTTGLNIALVGLGFGAEFVPIYRDHPAVGTVTICDSDDAVLTDVGDRFGIAARVRSLADVLADPAIDAVHLITPIPLHGQQAIAVLKAGKHCASTVPMAVDIEEMREIVRLENSTGKNYMMMETAVYTREFLHCADLYAQGLFGNITFAKGSHYQDMEGWPSYWKGLPPFWYMTHAISPALRLLNTRALAVRSLGSGTLPDERRRSYGNPFPAETAVFELADTDVAMEVSRTLFQAARSYTEAFAIYGERYGFEWPQLEEEMPVHFSLEEGDIDRGRRIEARRVEAPDRADLLPPEIARYTRESVYDDGSHASFVQGGGHSGSHPHLVHEFVTSIVEGRRAAVDSVTAANWSAPGVLAHESALKGGAPVEIPLFARADGSLV